METWSAIEYIKKSKKLSKLYWVLESEAKFIFEMDLADLLSALVLTLNYADLYAIVLYAKQIYSIKQHCPIYTNQNNQNKYKKKQKIGKKL